VRTLQVAAQAIAAQLFPGHWQSSCAALPAVSFFYNFMIYAAEKAAKKSADNCRKVCAHFLKISQVSRLISAPRVINNVVYTFTDVPSDKNDIKGYK
jgi:isopentenyldiphosphate isomerase